MEGFAFFFVRFWLFSLFVAQYDEYRPHLIQHLVDRKIAHWDTVIRQLTSQVKFKLFICKLKW